MEAKWVPFQIPDTQLWKRCLLNVVSWMLNIVLMSTFHVIVGVLTLTACTWFEHISMLVILLNCVTLGMFQPCEDISCLSDWCRILQVSGPHTRVFTVSLSTALFSAGIC